MQLIISRMKENHFSEEYLTTLNDSEYMRFSQQRYNQITFETQCEYLKTFDFSSNYLLAITDKQRGNLVASATLRLLPESKLINIGLLVLKNFGGQGLGKVIMRTLSSWVSELFPTMSQQIGTRRENIGMQKLALSAEFIVDERFGDSQFIYFLKESPPITEPLMDAGSNFHLVCNDAGGAFHISALANALIPGATATLSGPAKKIFAINSPSIPDLSITSKLILDKKILLGSGLYGGMESEILESQLLSSNFKIVLLDHWMNYQERFSPNSQKWPDLFIVTNQYAEEIANTCFPHRQVQCVPDFLLAEQKRKYLSEKASPEELLFILEPDSKVGEGLNYSIGELQKYIPCLIKFAKHNNVEKITLRKHPSHSLIKGLNLNEFDYGIEISYSSNESLITDLLRAKFVFGFHSSALYTSSSVGVKTYSFFAGAEGHWTKYFPEILEIN
jgi:RimJ/RimL family protein N-acetyltransferase